MSRSALDHEEAERLLSHWITGMPEQLREMRAELLDDDFPFDFSADSLAALEAHLLTEYAPGEEVRADFRPTLCSMLYLGEALLSVAGGSWGWTGREAPGAPGGQPVVCPDPELGLSPLAPFLLIAYAVRTRTGDAFTREAERLRAAVDGLREHRPGWQPATDLHPVEAERRSGADHPELARWLDARQRAFPAWAEGSGAADRWDFTPASLTLLEDVVRRGFGSDDEVLAAKNTPFLQGAVWYIGEVVRHTRPDVTWQYRPQSLHADEPSPLFDPHEPSVLNTPHLGQPTLRHGGAAYPLGALNVLFWKTDELDNPIEPQLTDILGYFAG
ncbi:hypothetical protein [Streptomyces sp. HNM0574]|uniref:hypothetical protein n=1 Tax=Streptomyces sp. HNM0574 TaxID=2714954 RepID=UPI00146D0ED6|nr:hypothetical protein [Streptomyces sp. HNM0574]NLU66658.1 hypothetical protein [Streptomyces sp. HNM0574]